MKNSWKKMILTAAALTALALFAGCTTASAVSLEEAKTLVQETMGAKDAVVIEQETDREEGVYELEIIVDGTVYEFEVDSATGAIRELERETPKTTQPAETKPVQTQPAQAKTITLDEAKAIAYAHAGVSESDAYDRSYERDDGIFEIDFDYDGWEYEYHISLEGEILSSRKERDDDPRPAQTQPAETKPVETKPSEQKTTEKKSDRISAEKALSIALGHAGVSDAFDREVEWDDGRWEVSFQSGRTEYDYDISADGTILRWEKELDD